MRHTRARAGFTLIEILVVLVITAIISTALYQMLLAGQQSYDRQKVHVEMQQNARVGLESLADDLREVSYGKDPTQPSIGTAAPHSVIFVADIMPEVPGAERISYYLSPDGDPDTDNPDDTILMRVVADSGGTVLVSDPQSYGIAANGLSFRWYNGSGVELPNPVPQPEQVGEIYVELTAASAKPVDGEYLTLSLSTTIYPRNLPLSPARSRPSTPGCSNPTYPNCESATLDWLTPTTNTDGTPLDFNDISHFNFYFGTDPAQIDIYTRLARTINQWTVGNLEAGQVYFIAVSCVSLSGVESYLCQRQASPASSLQPKAPADLTADSGTGVELNWDPVTEFTTDDPITTSVSYNVYRGTSPGFTPTESNRIETVSSGTSYRDTEPSACGTYYYQVRALACGNEGASSPERSGVLPSAPSCPGDIVATALETLGEIQVTWTEPTTRSDGSPLSPADIQIYRVYVDSIPGSTASYVEAPGGTTSWVVTGLTKCTTYYANVGVEDTCGNEGFCPGSETAVFTSAPCNPDIPTPPPTASLTAYDNSVRLEWPANTVDCDHEGYRIYYGESTGGPYDGTGAREGRSPITVSIDAVTFGDLCRFDLTGLDGCTQYAAVVTSIDQCEPPNESAYSPEASGLTTCAACAIDANCVSWALSNNGRELNLELLTNSGGDEPLSKLTPTYSSDRNMTEVWIGRPLTKIWASSGSAGQDGAVGSQPSGTVLDLDDVTIGSWTSDGDGEPLRIVFDGDVGPEFPVDLQFEGVGICTAAGSGIGTYGFYNFDNGRSSGWSALSGNWFVSSGALSQSLTGGNYVITCGSTDLTETTIDAKVNSTGGTNHSAYLAFRIRDRSNYTLFGIRTDQNKVHVINVRNNSASEVGNAYTALSDNTWYDLRVVVRGSHIQGYLDCNLLIDVDSSAMHSIGKAGLATRRASGSFDDVRIYATTVNPT